ncbi:hypothetical protein BpHYR1_046763 [Brachionus plicatilis]|uniref:Uncharacterized protein n=1 Tax=Brachionus plicatilis TaxID=10195 RepID=A0A3M7SE50_BRAPC|nr:hypothetical protein BpHYR1_046763 [Brachionus plicatilis]
MDLLINLQFTLSWHPEKKFILPKNFQLVATNVSNKIKTQSCQIDPLVGTFSISLNQELHVMENFLVGGVEKIVSKILDMDRAMVLDHNLNCKIIVIVFLSDFITFLPEARLEKNSAQIFEEFLNFQIILNIISDLSKFFKLKTFTGRFYKSNLLNKTNGRKFKICKLSISSFGINMCANNQLNFYGNTTPVSVLKDSDDLKGIEFVLKQIYTISN